MIMSRRLWLLLPLLALFCWSSPAPDLRAEDAKPPKEEGPPKVDTPKQDGDKPADPSAPKPDAPTPADGDAPADDKPADPKPDDVKKDDVKKDDGKSGGPKGLDRDGKDEQDAELPDDPDGGKQKDDAPVVAETNWPPLPEGIKAGPAGTVFIAGGPQKIGTNPRVLSKMLASQSANTRALFQHERPVHERYIEPHNFQRFEVSNAQYRRFLDDYKATYNTGTGGLGTIDRIVKEIWQVDKREAKNVKYKLWHQFYLANKQAIWDSFKAIDKLEDLVVRRPGGAVDEYNTAKKMRHEPLPRGLELSYLSPMRPPSTWKSYDPPKDQLDHPVRGPTYNDFELLAEWAGMHVQTEFEYEHAARGAKTMTFPWGEHFPLTTERCNWGAKITKNYEPTTVPVHAMPAGQSWCGAFNMVGNVAEWTSSWFENYPENDTPNKFLGRVIKIIRGGSGKDLVQPVLRPAYRNWQAGASKAPPYPTNGFPWVGTRMAGYIESGRDQLGPIVRRIVRYHKVKEHHLDIENFKGTVTNNWAPAGSIVTDHMYVLSKSAAVVFVPIKAVLQPDADLRLKELWEKPTRARKTSSLNKRSESENGPIFVLGVLHTDVALDKVLVPEPEPVVDPNDPKKKPKPRRRRRNKGPAVVPGTCPPGTYALAYWHGRLCLTTQSLSFVCFIDKYPGQKWQAKIEKKVEPQPTILDIDTDLDEGVLQVQLPLGGKKADGKYTLVVDALLVFKTGALEASGDGKWLTNTRPAPPAPDADDGTGDEPKDGDSNDDDAKDGDK